MWTYSGDPATSPRDEVRYLIRDIVSTRPLVTDEEINFELAQNNNVPIEAAWRLAELIASNFGSKGSKTVGSTSISYSEQAKGWSDLAESLRKRAGTKLGGLPFVGGIDKEQDSLMGGKWTAVSGG